jgi:hyperosmotically inducible protein
VDKVNAEKRARKIKNVDGLRNHIRVAGPAVPDAELTDRLTARLRYDRIGYGIMFNNLNVQVQDGTVTIGGKVRDYPDRDSAIAIAETTPGVKDVMDEIEVASASTSDDELRLRLARAIYGHSALQKYALDPQAPIRIVVDGGQVELHGMVLTGMEKQVAFTAANSVPGVFSVKNHIVAASEIAK